MHITKIPIGIDNCYLLEAEKTILIDSGPPGMSKLLNQKLQKKGITISDIDLLILTHEHWDHSGNAMAIRKGSNAKVLVQEDGKKAIEEGLAIMPPGITAWGKFLSRILSFYTKSITIPRCSVDIAMQESLSLKEYGIEGEAVATPGHSPGSLSVVLDDGKAFVGDMAMNQIGLTLGPSLPIFAVDRELLLKSWEKLIAKGAQMIYPAHGAPFHIGRIKHQISTLQ